MLDCAIQDKIYCKEVLAFDVDAFDLRAQLQEPIQNMIIGKLGISDDQV